MKPFRPIHTLFNSFEQHLTCQTAAKAKLFFYKRFSDLDTQEIFCQEETQNVISTRKSTRSLKQCIEFSKISHQLHLFLFLNPINLIFILTAISPLEGLNRYPILVMIRGNFPHQCLFCSCEYFKIFKITLFFDFYYI